MLASLLLSLAAQDAQIAPASCDVGEATPEQREALKDFDFLIGDYSVTGHQWTGDAWSPPQPNVPPARWNGRYGQNGTTIIDEWWDQDPGITPGANAGTNVRIKRPDGSWVMSWVSMHRYGVQHLEAQLLGNGDVEMVQVYPERKGFVAIFKRLDANNWVRIHHGLDAEGNRLPPIMLKATRIPCTPETPAPESP